MARDRSAILPAPGGRDGALDVLKLVLAFLVIGLHGNVLREAGTAANIPVHAVLRLAVPTFFLISGLFLHAMSPAQTRTWAWRLLVMYAGWSLVYTLPWLLAQPRSPAETVTTLVFGHHHLWFLSALIGAGLLLDRMRAFSTPLLLGLAGLTFATGVAIQYAGNLHLAADAGLDALLNQFWVYRNFLFFGFPFLTLGFLTARHAPALALPRRTTGLLFLAGLALLSAERALNVLLTGGRESFDLMLALPLACVPLLLWTRSFRTSLDTRPLAAIATTVYLVHVMVLDAVQRATDLPPTPTVLVTAALSAAIAYAALRLRRGLPAIPGLARARPAAPQDASR